MLVTQRCLVSKFFPKFYHPKIQKNMQNMILFWYTHSFVHLRIESFQNHHLTNTLPIQQKHQDPPMAGWPGLHWNRLGLSHQTWLPRSASDKRISGWGGNFSWDLAWWYGKIIGKVNHHRSMAFFLVDCGQNLDRSLSSLEMFLFE